MQKSIFARYFAVCASIIVISVTILGASLLLSASQFFKDDQYDKLQANAKAAAGLVRNNQQVYGNRIVVSELRKYLSELSVGLNTEFLLVDNQGFVHFSTVVENIETKGYSISAKTLKAAEGRKGFFEVGGTLEGIYDDKYYTFGTAVRSVVDDETVVGYVFTSYSAENMNAFLMSIFKMFIWSSVFVILLAFITIYIATARMVRPLKEMSQAARQYGRGDFSKRIAVYRDDEIGELAYSLNNMANDLAVMEKTRRNFTANVSHELKTPMQSIGGFIDGVLDGTIPPEDHTKYLRIVSEEVKRLSRMVRSMLNLSKIEVGEMKLTKRPFNIVNVVAQTLFSFERVIGEKQIEVKGLDWDAVFVNADEDLIHQVVYNLVENAVKFVNQGGYIAFDFSERANFCFVSIKNSGQGLSKEEIPRVFDRFYKTDKSRGLDKSGVGLGLYLVRSIINLNDGEIYVRSVQGEYCEFIFSLETAKNVKQKKRIESSGQPSKPENAENKG